MAKVPTGGIHVIVEGLTRAKADLITKHERVAARDGGAGCPIRSERTLEVDAYVRRLQELIDRALSLSTGLSQELRGMVAGIDDPLRLAYLLTSLLDMKAEEKQLILENDDRSPGSCSPCANALGREIALLEMKSKIESEAQQEMTDAQRQVLPAPAAEGDSGRARRRREAGEPGVTEAAGGGEAARGGRPRSRSGSSIGSSGCRRRRPSTR